MLSLEVNRRLVCPACRHALESSDSTYRCSSCGRTYPLVDQIPIMLTEAPALPPERSSELDLTVLLLTPEGISQLDRTLPEIARVVQDLGITFEMLIVGGEASMSEVSERHGARFQHLEKWRYGTAFRAGLELTQGRYLLTLDPDLSHDPNFLRLLWHQRNHAEVIIGSRYVHGAEAFMPWPRTVLSRLLNRVLRRALSIPIMDLSSGFRLYRRAILDWVGLEACDYDILIETVSKLYAEGFSARETAYLYRPRGTGFFREHARVGLANLRSLFKLWRLRNSVDSADYDSRAYHSWIYPQRWWQRTRHQIMTRFVGSDVSDILDVGCGSAKLIQSLPGAVGVDMRLAKLRFLKGIHPMLVNASIFALPFAEASFSTVICTEVIEHVPDPDQALAELVRVLRPGGKLILGTPDYSTRNWRIIEPIYEKVIPGGYAGEHITHLTREILHGMLDRAGVDLLDEDYVLNADWIGMGRKRG